MAKSVPNSETGGAQPRRIRIRVRGPAGSPFSREDPGAASDGDEYLKTTFNTCESSPQRNIIANKGSQIFAAANYCTKANIKELMNENTLVSVNKEIESLKKEEPFNGDMGTICRGILVRYNAWIRLMACDTRTKGRKMFHSSLGLPTSSQFKTSKTLSSTDTRPSINDLPDSVLVEILCRLPTNKAVFQCKSVSKRWLTLITDPYFIDRFVHIQRYKNAPKIFTLMNRKAEEFPPKTSSWRLPGVLAPVFSRIRSIHGHVTPIVVATCKDLVLCCTGSNFQGHYYICNAYTKQMVAIPPAPIRLHDHVRVGLICDIPYYYTEEGDNRENRKKKHQFNGECRWKVVKFFPADEFEFANDENCDSIKLKVDIFSSETGKWTERAVSSPQHFDFAWLGSKPFQYNGMIYWKSSRPPLFIGLGPFNDDNKSSNSSCSNGDGDPKLGLSVSQCFGAHFLGARGECIQWCRFCKFSRTFHVWDLRQDADAVGTLCLSKYSVHSLDPKMYPDNPISCAIQAFDPVNEDIFYLHVDGDLIKCNFRTREWSKMDNKFEVGNVYYFQVELPWWPTPVPKLLLQPHDQISHPATVGGTSLASSNIMN